MLQSCRPTLHCRPVRYLRRSVRWPVRALCAEVPDKRVRSTAALGAVDLPHGVLWWSDRSHSVYQHNVLHGQDFVLQRPRPGGPGLILAKQLSSVQLVDQEERKRVSIQAYQMQASDRCAPLAITDILTFDVTEYALVEDAASNNLAAPCFPPTDCTGMVLVSQNSDKQQEQVCTVVSQKPFNSNATFCQP